MKRGNKVFLAFLLVVTLLSVFVSAGFVNQDERYFVGDEIKLDFSDYVDYTLRIKTPYGVFLKEGNEDVFRFSLKERGDYTFDLKSENEEESYSIFVYSEGEEIKEVDEKLEKKDEVNSENESEKNDTDIKIENKTSNNFTVEDYEDSLDEEYVRKIEVGKPVLNKKKIIVNESSEVYDLPYSAENVSVKKNGKKISFSESVGVGSRIMSVFSESNANRKIAFENETGELDLEYYTPAPEKKEKEIDYNKKEVVVSAADYLEYENVYTEVEVNELARSEDEVKVVWKDEGLILDFDSVDSDSDGYIDKVSFYVPHLSTQTFEIVIEVMEASLFDENGDFVRDVYSEVYDKDDSGIVVLEGEFLRVKFEELLDNSRDITFIGNGSENSFVEVYEKDSDVLLGTFSDLEEYKERKVFLNLLDGEQDTFDLKVVAGSVYFNYITDPSFYTVDSDSFEDGNWVSDFGNNWQTSITGGTLDIDNEMASDGSWSMSAGNSRRSQQTAILPVDTTGFTNISVSFYYASTGRWETEDCFYFDWTSDGSNWNNELTLCGDFPNGATFTLGDYELTAAAENNPNFQIRFIHDNPSNGNQEESWVDDIVITGYGNSAPSIDSVEVSSIGGHNSTDEDLVCSAMSSDLDSDPVSYVYNWILNGSDFAVLNLPFGVGSTDSSTRDYTGSYTVSSSANYVSSGSHDGSGYYSFDGSSSLTISSDMSSILGDTGTVMFWIRTTQVGDDTVWLAPGVFGVEESGASNDIFWGHINSVGQIGVTAGDGSTAFSSSSINDGLWHHIVMTRDSVSGEVQMFVDGSFSSSAISETGVKSSAFDEIGVIEDTGGSPEYFVGDLDEFMAYDFLMTPEQITSIYNANYDTILSEETNEGDSFVCEVTPNDGFLEGATAGSSSLLVVETPVLNYANVTINNPSGTINSPVNLLELYVNGTADAVWYNIDGGENYVICRNCGGNVQEYIPVYSEGNHVINAYTNLTGGGVSSDSSSINLDLNYQLFEDFNYNFSLDTFSDTYWNSGSVNFDSSFEIPQSDDFEVYPGNFNGVLDISPDGTCAWYRNSGTTPSNNVGPNGANSGNYYVYTEASNNQGCYSNGDTAVMTSDTFYLNGVNSSLDFYYHMYGGDIGTLYVDIYSGGEWTNIWSLTGQQQADWTNPFYPASVDLTGYSGDVQIRFRAVAIGGWQADMAIDDISVNDLDAFGEVVSVPISLQNTAAEFTDVSWSSINSDSNNIVSVNVSANGGSTWYSATNGAGIVGIDSGTELLYKIIFESDGSSTLGISNLNIEWTDTASPPPSISINYPAGSIPDVTPVLDVSITGGTASNFWYTLNGGPAQNVCSGCTGNIKETLYLQEGTYTLVAYVDNSLGVQNTDSVTFTVDMNGNYFDTYSDDSQLWTVNEVGWEEGNVSYLGTKYVTLVNETFENDDGWSYSGGTWNIQNNELEQTENTQDMFAIYDDYSLSAGKNYNISMRYMNADDDESGLIFRYLDSNNYYVCSFMESGGAGNVPGLVKFEGGASTVYGNTVYDMPDVYNEITVEIKDGTTNCYLNGNLAYSTNDVTWETGKVGIYNNFDDVRGSGAYTMRYDDVSVVEDLSDSFFGFVSYPIKTLLDFVEILNVSWNTHLVGSQNNITVEISTDNGANWHEVQNGDYVGQLEVDNDLVYRVNFDARESELMSLLDMNITWTHEATPAPTISITNPGAVVSDTTPIIETSLSGTANTYWYTVNGGEKNVVCTECSGNIDVPVLLAENDYVIEFYANNSVGDISSESVSFEVNMNRNYFDTFLDGTQIKDFDGSVSEFGNLTFYANGLGGFYDFEEGSMPIEWSTYSSNVYGRIGVREESSYSGGHSVIADSNTDGNNVLNELITASDFSGAQSVVLDFYWTDFGDETNSPSDHIGHENSDGVFFTCDGNQWYTLYDFQPASNTDNVWNHVNIDVSADPDFCLNVDSNFAIKFTQYDNFVFGTDGMAWDDINISIPGGKSSVVSHPINVSQNIRRIADVSWNTNNEDINNPIDVELSVDGGNTWNTATSGTSLEGFAAGSSLVYRVNFSAIENRVMSLLDMNITWEEPPSVNILYPNNNYVYNSAITKMNYTVDVSGSETLDSCWYTTDGGLNNNSVICGNDIPVTSVDGVNTWIVYANDSSGSVGSDTVQFIIDTSAPSIVFLNQSSSPVDQGSQFEVNVNVSDTNTDSVWIVIWENVVGGVSKFTGLLNNIVGDLFSGSVDIDSGFNLSHNYTIYANDTTGLVSNYTSSFDVLKAFFTLDNNPVYSDGVLPAYVSGYLGLTSGSDLSNHAFNIWLDGSLVPFENLTAHGDYLSELNFTGQDELFSGSYLENVSDAGGYMTLSGTNTSGSMVGVMDAGALVDWGYADWDLLSGSCSGTVNYYDGVSWGYKGVEDTYIDSENPTTNYGISSELNLDTSPATQRVLLKFSDIFGFGLNKIPYDSSISSATLSSYVYTTGNAPTLYEVLEDWGEGSATYNGRLSGSSWSSTGVSGYPSRSNTPLGTISATTAGTKSLTITELVRSWNNRSSENYGLVFNPGGSSGVQLRSSEYATINERPRLDVSFSSSECAGIEVYYRTSRDKVVWSDWRQVFMGEEIVDDYGESRYLEYKVLFGSYDGVVKPNLWDIEFNYTATVTDQNGLFNYSFYTPETFGSYNLNFTSGYRTIFTYEEAELKVQSGIDPVLTIVSPENNYWSDFDAQTIAYNATDLNLDLAGSTLVVDSVNVLNNQSALVNAYNEFDYTFSEGCHNWSVNVSDSTGLTDESSNRTICIDLTDPFVSLNYPPADASYTVGYLNFSFEASDNLDSALNCSVNLDGVNIGGNESSLNSTITNVSSGALSGGTHFWNVTCIDEAERSFTSETREFTITDTPPTVSLISPEELEVVTSDNVSFVFFADDNSGMKYCEVLVDGVSVENTTNVNLGVNNTVNVSGISDGEHNYTVRCLDLSDSVAMPENRTFYHDTVGPTIELFYPSEGYVSFGPTQNFDIKVTDLVDDQLDCSLYVGDSLIDNLVADSGVRFNHTSSSLDDGLGNWRFECSDDSSHVTVSENRSIDVRWAPVIYLNTTNETHFSGNTPSLEFTPSDNTDVDTCSLYVNGALNDTITSVVNDGLNIFEPSGFSDGVYNYYIECSDSNSNSGVSPSEVFVIDNGMPVMNLTFPLNEPVYAQNITFNYSAVDDFASELNCSITVDSLVVDSYILTNASVASRVVSNISDGVHLWNLTCVDFAGNENTSETYNFTRFTAPGVNLVSPDNNTWMNVSDFAFVYYPMDDEGFDSSELYLNSVLEDTDNSVTSYVDNWFNVSLSDGVYDWYVKVIDSSLMPQDSEIRRVYVDTQAPVLELGLPSEGFVYDKNGVDFNFTVSDNLDSEPSCELYLDGSMEWSGNVSSGVEEVVELLVVDGNHSYNISCVDEAENYAVSETVNFTVYAPPVIELVSPVNMTKTQNSSVNFSYIPWDDLGLIECSMYFDSVKGETSYSVVPNVVNNFSVSSISEGVHNWSVECVDTDMNTEMGNVSILIRDVTAPKISMLYPGNNSGIDFNLGSVDFRWNVTDNLDDYVECDLYVDSELKRPNLLIGNSSERIEVVGGLSQGEHNWSVDCNDFTGNVESSDVWSFNYSLPDFEVVNFTSNVSVGVEGESVFLNGTIRNVGEVDSQNVLVEIYSGHPSEGALINSSSVDLAVSEEIEIYGVSNLSIGLNDYWVVVDYLDNFNEFDKGNNILSKNISVGAWQFFYGDVNPESEYVLGSDVESVIVWNVSDFSGGTIFVSDKDSSVDWSSLMPLGRDVNNVESLDDFSDADSLLGMTGFSDSIEELYLNGGAVEREAVFSVFGRSVTNVPITTSIASLNFYTGVLWDSSDDLNSEYDVSDSEDLVFGTEINPDALGSYGTYDYEIRVPAGLRDYAGTSSEAVFYVEL